MQKNVYERSFAYFLMQEREKLRGKYGDNWNKYVSEKLMKNIISEILDKEDLIMHIHVKNFWKNKIKYEYGHMKILQIFFSPELAQYNLRVHKKITGYR